MNMNLNQNLNLNGSIIAKDSSGVERPIMSVTVGFTNQTNFSFGFHMLDPEAVNSNAENVQVQLNEFMVSIRNKMKELGYVVTI